MQNIKKNHLILTLLILLCSLNSSADNRPLSVVKEFYDWRFNTPFTGIPEKATLSAAESFLGQDLICMLDVARDYRNRFAKKIPTDKPPFIEGDIFTSLFEGANRFTEESMKVNGEKAVVRLHFYHDRGAKKDKAGWRDTVSLQLKNQQWRIKDIQYGGKFDFGNNGSLRQNLLEELSQDNRELDWQGKMQLSRCLNVEEK